MIVDGSRQPKHGRTTTDVLRQEREAQAKERDAEEAAPPLEAGSSDQIEARGKVARQLTLKQKILITLEEPTHSRAAAVVAFCMVSALIISTISFVLEPELSETGFGLLEVGMVGEEASREWRDTLRVVDQICVSMFTIDVLLRFLCRASLRRFFGDTFNWVDMLAVLPFWLGLLLSGGAGASSNLQFLRVIRLIRVLRLFKFGRYSIVIQLIMNSVLKSVTTFVILFGVLFIVVIISAALIQIVEEENPSHQRECFATILTSFWWAAVTMTTVGYGDCYPSTKLGKVVATVAMVIGVTFLALPITIVGSNFAQLLEMYEDDASSFNFMDIDGDGSISEEELREFMVSAKKHSLLKPGLRAEDLKVKALIEKFDLDGTGELSMSEFARLRQEIIAVDKVDPMEVLKGEVEALKGKAAATEAAVLETRAEMREALSEVTRLLRATS